MNVVYRFLAILFVGGHTLFIGCAGSGGETSENDDPSSGGGSPAASITPIPSPTAMPADNVLSEKTLNADGVDSGLSAYELIREFGGPSPIEAPDLYDVNHPGVPHIFEDYDEVVGNHFVFVIHRDIDIDRDRIELTDRQRNEIKAYSGSERSLKAYENDVFEYRWKFRVNNEMEVSRNFTHLFQLKAVGSGSSTPLMTISGAERDGVDMLELRHSPIQDTSVVASNLWASILGEWVEVKCRVLFSNSGSVRLDIERLSDSVPILSYDQSGIDMWRGENSEDFVRPKWGILRSLNDRDNLRPDEEDVRFASFVVTRLAEY